jgi:eukaryotic-like serine/threonine-protein kinase
VSADGSVMATCQSAGAYLLYWSPDQGFVADNVNRGPANPASVVFRGSGGGVVMQVTCSGGTPTATVHPIDE